MAKPTEKPVTAPDPAILAALERKVLWLSTWTIHHANHLRENADGLKVGGHQASCASLADPHDRALFPRAPAGGPGGGQAACEPGVPRDPVSPRPPEPRQRSSASAPSAARSPIRRAPRTRRRRLLDRLGRAWRRRHRSSRRLVQDYLAARGPGLGEPAAGPDDRAGRRCRARRRQCLRGLLEGWKHDVRNLLVDHRLQPPEPRRRRRRGPVPADHGLLRDGRLGGVSSNTASSSRRPSRGPAARRSATGSTTARTISIRRSPSGRRRAGGSAFSTISATERRHSALLDAATTTRACTG